jgi:3-methylcrotonyl-CoA carboxylase alpha subunit
VHCSTSVNVATTTVVLLLLLLLLLSLLLLLTILLLLRAGDEVSVYYDPMIAKLVAWGSDRSEALARLLSALRQFQVLGVPTNIEFCERCARHPAFAAGGVTTKFLESYGSEVTTLAEAAVPQHAVVLGTLALMLHREGRFTADHSSSSSSGSSSSDPWSAAAGPWRAVQERRVTVNYTTTATDATQQQQLAVPVVCSADGSYTVDGIAVRGSLSASGELSAFVDGRHYKLSVDVQDGSSSSGSTVTLWHSLGPVQGDTQWRSRYTLSIAPRAAAISSSAASAGALKAPMPGKVVRVLVRAGAAVQKGQPLVIMEAMKMEHTITAPAAGTVAAVLFEEGQLVQDGSVLISMQESKGVDTGSGRVAAAAVA